MGAEIRLTTAADLPGADVDPAAVEEHAAAMRVAGAALQHETAAVARTWQRVPGAYEASGTAQVYAAMDPVAAQGQDIGQALRGAAAALDAYADEVRPILRRIASLAQDVEHFSAVTVRSYPKDAPAVRSYDSYAYAGGSAPAQRYESWHDDIVAVEANHDLLVRAHHLQGELLEAQQQCASAIRAAAGLAAFGTAEVAAAVQQLDATDVHWNAAVAISNDAEGCAGSTNRALNGIFYDGVFIDGVVGTVQGLGGLVGWDGDHEWSWATAGRSWVGLAHLASGIVLTAGLGPAGVAQLANDEQAPGWLRDWDRDSVGSALGLTGLVGVSTPREWWKADAWVHHDYIEAWEEHGWETLGSSAFNVGTLLTGAGAATKVGEAGRLLAGGRRATIGELVETGGINALRGNDAARLMRLIPSLGSADAARLEGLLRVPRLDLDAVRDLGLQGHVVKTSYEIAHDPVHETAASGRGWERQPDPVPKDPDHGLPRASHGTSAPLPGADPLAGPAHPSLEHLRGDPEAPYGRDAATGVPLGHPGLDQRFTLPSSARYPNGVRYPDGAEANPGTIVRFDSMRAYTRIYGARLDRIGPDTGKWFAVEPKQGAFTFEARSIPTQSLKETLYRFTLARRLPPGWHIEVSEVREALGRPGGALQVRILDASDRPVAAEQLLGEPPIGEIPVGGDHAGETAAAPGPPEPPKVLSRR